jgi:hypothetical protein
MGSSQRGASRRSAASLDDTAGFDDVGCDCIGAEYPRKNGRKRGPKYIGEADSCA